jgi:hypothetical protein
MRYEVADLDQKFRLDKRSDLWFKISHCDIHNLIMKHQMVWKPVSL